jgi:hypothetical protein
MNQPNSILNKKIIKGESKFEKGLMLSKKQIITIKMIEDYKRKEIKCKCSKKYELGIDFSLRRKDNNNVILLEKQLIYDAMKVEKHPFTFRKIRMIKKV